jgi:Tol biopolymer transport system component
LDAGEKLGPYEILAPLGAGGMGEVYRARDTKLGREVAIKVLPDSLSQHPDRLARFEREAKVLAALNHPNIAQIYSIEDRALVMELVPGKTLKGPLPLETALNYAAQIASALQAAHDKGIVHRDLKPGNIMVTPEGVVKVLDFGLAMQSREPGSASPEDSPTLTIGATQAGVIMGTAAYMSPEQASGQPVDRRSDIWSFGVVLLETLTGERAFTGETVSHVLAGVLAKEPDVSRTPANVQRLLKSCLQKDPRQRLQAIGDWKLAVDTPGPPVPLQPASPQSRFGIWGWTTVALALAAIPLGYLAYRHNTEEAPHVLRFTVPPPEQGTLAANGFPQLSPDGHRIAYLARVLGAPAQLWVRDLDSLTSRLLVKEVSRSPFWSPDGRSIGFWSGGKLQRMDASGGPALTLCNAPPVWGGTWNRDEVILFAPPTGPIQRVSAAGGTPTPVTTVDTAANESRHNFPWFLPDGRHFFYTAVSTDDEKTAIYVGDLQSKDTRTRVMPAKSNAVYVAPGYILFMREQTLMAQPFDAGKLRTTGDAFPIAEQVDASNAGNFTASQNGVLAYESGRQGQTVQMTWFDRSGKPLGTVGSPGDMEWVAISPDGKTVAFDRRDAQTGILDIWMHDLARGTDSRFTFNSKNNRFPVWSPDGNYLAFNSDRSGHQGVYKKATNGVVQDEVVDKDDLTKRPTGWSPDDRFILEETNAATAKTLNDIWIAPASPGSGNEKPRPYLQTEFQEGQGKLSPNGKWLAYRSDETKRNEVYIMTFPSPGRKWPISTSGGGLPIWSRDGRQLFYVSATNKMMAVDIKGSGTNPEPGVPQPLFDVRLGPNNPGFDVAKDGRFLIATPVEQTSVVPITVVVNWMAGLK